MKSMNNILRLLLPLILIMFFSSCAPSKKNAYYEKRVKASSANTPQLGRNKYYFSGDYQKKLVKSYKRK